MEDKEGMGCMDMDGTQGMEKAGTDEEARSTRCFIAPVATPTRSFKASWLAATRWFMDSQVAETLSLTPLVDASRLDCIAACIVAVTPAAGTGSDTPLERPEMRTSSGSLSR
jgi:hypothetical protein